MKRAVQFELVAPLASWGDRLSGSVRPSAEVPTWSALVGILGAALGLRRGDPLLAALAADYAPALQARSLGEPMDDFHTVEAAPQRPAINAWTEKHGTLRTRAEELEASNRTSPVITRRAYRMDIAFTVWVVPVTERPRVPVSDLVSALNAPRFTLSAGRRSCVLSEPVRAQDVDVSELVERATHWDSRIGAIKPHVIERRRQDLLLNAGQRSFGPRRECVAAKKPEAQLTPVFRDSLDALALDDGDRS